MSDGNLTPTRSELRALLEQAEQAILALRRKLRAADPTLPSEYDGTAWQPLEQEHYEL